MHLLSISVALAASANAFALPKWAPRASSSSPLPALPINSFNTAKFAKPLTLNEALSGKNASVTTMSESALQEAKAALPALVIPENVTLPHDNASLERDVEDFEKRQTTCSNVRVRMEWDSASNSNKQNYINAVKCLMGKPPSGVFKVSKSRYDDLVGLHQILTPNVHGNAKFLLWHRYFVWTFEQLLRNECGFTDNLLWFDETRYAGNFPASSLFSSQWYGSVNVGGNCVTNGQFANLPCVYGPGTSNTPHCLARNNDNSETANTGSAIVNACNSRSTYANMASCAEGGAHAWGHNGIGAVMQDVYASPSDPVFFLHHGFIDRNFRIWQNQNPSVRTTTVGGTDYAGRPLTLNTNVNVYGFMPDTTIGAILDTTKTLCYNAAQQSSTSAQKVIALLSLHPNVETGHLHETFEDAHFVRGNRSASTASYYLLEGSVGWAEWHRVDAVEMWSEGEWTPAGTTVAPGFVESGFEKEGLDAQSCPAEVHLLESSSGAINSETFNVVVAPYPRLGSLRERHQPEQLNILILGINRIRTNALEKMFPSSANVRTTLWIWPSGLFPRRLVYYFRAKKITLPILTSHNIYLVPVAISTSSSTLEAIQGFETRPKDATLPILRISRKNGEETWIRESLSIIQYFEELFPASDGWPDLQGVSMEERAQVTDVLSLLGDVVHWSLIYLINSDQTTTRWSGLSEESISSSAAAHAKGKRQFYLDRLQKWLETDALRITERMTIAGVVLLAQVEYHEMIYKTDWIEGHTVLGQWIERMRGEEWYVTNRALKDVEDQGVWEKVFRN
ncbi:hypothetical protein OPT61_g1131 [Boeremia exigua]|uniref:Uncharacterized protein n=1 Tax=Boeremia exigua TaxID=749465 RepID=A0ACC2IRA4_9PLEO|nr:hypothetical protein OPT61_g1131 [Boeremia exigua]